MGIIKTFLLTIQATSLAFAMTTGAQAQTQNCKAMADMAKYIANIRDMGIPISAVKFPERFSAAIICGGVVIAYS